MRTLNDLMLSSTVALSETSAAFDITHMFGLETTFSISAANQANAEFETTDVDAADDIITIVGHGYTTGALVQASSTTTLPAGLSGSTDYYIIVVDADNIQLASSQANALAGTQIDITDAGTGTHTIEVTTTLAGSVKLQKSNDPFGAASPIWFDVATATNFSAAGDINIKASDVAYPQLRAVVVVTSGTILATVRLNAKGG